MLTNNKNIDMAILNKLEDKELVNFCQTNTTVLKYAIIKFFGLNE